MISNKPPEKKAVVITLRGCGRREFTASKAFSTKATTTHPTAVPAPSRALPFRSETSPVASPIVPVPGGYRPHLATSSEPREAELTACSSSNLLSLFEFYPAKRPSSANTTGSSALRQARRPPYMSTPTATVYRLLEETLPIAETGLPRRTTVYVCRPSSSPQANTAFPPTLAHSHLPHNFLTRMFATGKIASVKTIQDRRKNCISPFPLDGRRLGWAGVFQHALKSLPPLGEG